MTASPEWTDEQIAAASAAELSAGRLPMRAQWRLAEQRGRAERGEPGAFTSDLTIEEFAAIRSVGFSPVGQVMGSAVYNVGWAYSGCGYYGYYGYGMAPVVPVPATQQLLNQARHRAVNRMRQECQALDGDGVVGVRLAVQRFHDIGLEFFAIGTAVRADGRKRPKKPFTSDLSGQDFAKRHKGRLQLAWGSSWFNQELVGSTKLVQAARAAARDSLTADARKAGGHTVVLRDTVLQVFESRCASGSEGEDQHTNAYLWGTAIVPYRRAAVSETPLQMLRLDR